MIIIANISLEMMKTIHCRNNNQIFAYHHQERDHLNLQLEVVLFVISRIQLTMVPNQHPLSLNLPLMQRQLLFLT